MGSTILIHAPDLEPGAREQIDSIARHPAIEGPVAIMPDAHQGAGCVIGFTGRFGEGVIPNIVGVDIGCGVALYPLQGVEKIDFPRLDDFIRTTVPLGMRSHDSPRFLAQHPISPTLRKEAVRLSDEIESGFYRKQVTGRHTPPLLQIGTLGGGNHFIEIDRDKGGCHFLVVHSGSRNLGKRIAEYYQERAREATRRMRVPVPRGQEFLPLTEGGREYLFWMERAQAYARLNRRMIISLILSFFQIPYDESMLVESVHNYVSERDRIVRKGAISAHAGERVIIPLTMADGVILGIAKGNREYNFSAPHGAGRRHGRKEMFRKLKQKEVTMEGYRETMKGIFSTSVTPRTIDESRFAYKPLEEIEPFLRETVEVTDRLTPCYNLKAEEE
ncbi:MAG: RNA-splicing ligase RtcB [Desulfuromonadia bacterium]